MRRLGVWGLAVVLAAALAAPAGAQEKLSPSETVLTFYGFLRENRFSEGLSYSVYREAVEGLAEGDLAELEQEFRQTFSDIPAKIEIRGEQVSGENATVFARFGPEDDVQEVALVSEGGRWLVGDREALEQVRKERTAFFINARIQVNHNEVFRLMQRIAGGEDVYFQTKQVYAELAELAALDSLGDDLKAGLASGYRFTVNLTPDRKAFTVVAIPVRYGRTGKLSFFANAKSIHASDAGGQPVNEQAPVLVEDVFKNPAERP
jgi:hypothetical protein